MLPGSICIIILLDILIRFIEKMCKIYFNLNLKLVLKVFKGVALKVFKGVERYYCISKRVFYLVKDCYGL